MAQVLLGAGAPCCRGRGGISSTAWCWLQGPHATLVRQPCFSQPHLLLFRLGMRIQRKPPTSRCTDWAVAPTSLLNMPISQKATPGARVWEGDRTHPKLSILNPPKPQASPLSYDMCVLRGAPSHTEHGRLGFGAATSHTKNKANQNAISAG